jgi:ribosomal protein S18 acetylase RimI-like enzyme
MRIVEIEDADIDAVVALWERCGLTRPWNDPRADVALARRTQSSTVLVGWADDAIVAAVMAGSDGHRGWFYYLGVGPDLQRQGLGREIMAAAEAWLQGQGVPKVQLMVRGDNATAQGFYRELGYEPQDVVVLGKRF